MSQPLSPPANPVPGAIYTEDLTGIAWIWTGVSWIEAGGSGGYNTQIKTGMALTPGFYSALSSTTAGGSGGTNLAQIATQYGPTAPVNPAFGQTWVDTTDANRPITSVWTAPGQWTKTSDGVTNMYVQQLSPTDHEIGDQWFNTSSNELYVFDGTQWRLVTGGGGGGTALAVQSYATTPPVQTEGSIVFNTTTDTLYISDGTNWVELDKAPDIDTNSILAIAAPTTRANGDPLDSGDLWIDTASNTVNYYDGTQWIRLASATVGDTHSFWIADPPTVRPDNTPLVAGDFWVDSDDAAAYVWTGSVWSPLVNSSDNNTNSIVSPTAPTQRPTANDPNLQTGDLWINSGDYSLSYFTGLTWVPITALTAAAGDKHSFTSNTVPTLVQRPDGNPLLIGDQYINTATNFLYYWSGAVWVPITGTGTDTHSFTGTGNPSGVVIQRPDSEPLQDGDMYIDDATNSVYYYDASATIWKSINAGGADFQTTSVVTGATFGLGFPTLRSDGVSALQKGDLFESSDTHRTYYYNGTSWARFDSFTFVSSSAPNRAEVEYGDTWFDTVNLHYYIADLHGAQYQWVQIF